MHENKILTLFFLVCIFKLFAYLMCIGSVANNSGCKYTLVAFSSVTVMEILQKAVSLIFLNHNLCQMETIFIVINRE